MIGELGITKGIIRRVGELFKGFFVRLNLFMQLDFGMPGAPSA